MFPSQHSKPMASRIACAALALTLFAVAMPAATANAQSGSIRGASRNVWQQKDFVSNDDFQIETTTIMRVDYDSVNEVATGTVTEVHIFENLTTGEISSSRVVYEVHELNRIDSDTAFVFAATPAGAGWVGGIRDAAPPRYDQLGVQGVGTQIPGYDFRDDRFFSVERGNYVVDL